MKENRHGVVGINSEDRERCPKAGVTTRLRDTEGPPSPAAVLMTVCHDLAWRGLLPLTISEQVTDPVF